MDENLKKLISWKTKAWKSKDMASWYAWRMAENVGTNQLMNAVETGLIEKFIVGSEVLDVGIGTGRASLPLLKKGLHITGIDSSQAMLDECKRLADNLPIQLRIGDVCALPFAEKSFDSLISLNVMTHFPHWREVLSEWCRVVKPAGRIVFDIYSIDHLSSVEGHTVTVDDLIKRGAGLFNMHLAAAELFKFADEAGLRVASITPYGSVSIGQYRRFNAAAALNTLNSWQRHMAWLTVDESLFDALLFIERNLFACLTTKTTGRYMVALDNEPDRAGNQQLQQRLAEVDRLLASKVALEKLAPHLLLPMDAWKAEFARHMAPLRNRVVAYLILTSFLGEPTAIDFASFFGESRGAELDEWLKAELDRWSEHKNFERWANVSSLQPVAQRIGAPIAGCMEHEYSRIMMNAQNIAGADL